jgi:hypothetical protein
MVFNEFGLVMDVEFDESGNIVERGLRDGNQFG